MYKKTGMLMTFALTLLCAIPLTVANAQTLRHIYKEQGPMTIVEEDRTNADLVPLIIERRVLVHPSVSPKLESETILPKRSNYSKRLGDMLEQLSFAYERGWLNSRQYEDLKSWEASVAMEELVLREKGNGVVAQADIDQLERHLNGLAYTINQQIEKGSRVARAEDNSL